MKKILSIISTILFCSAYMLWRIISALGSASVLSWVLVCAEAVIVAELAFYFVAKANKQSPLRIISNRQSKAIAILDTSDADEDSIEKSIFALNKSNEISESYILNELTESDIDNIKANSDDFVLWVNAGDIVFANSVTLCSNYVTNDTPIAVPICALWSSSINSESDIQNVDSCDRDVTSYISSKNGIVFTGETALISKSFFIENMLEKLELESSEIFAHAESVLCSASQKCTYAPIIAVERHVINPNTQVTFRNREIRHGIKAIAKFNFSLTNIRNASRPFRSLAIAALAGVAIVTSVTNSLPFNSSLTSTLLICAGFYLVIALANHRFKSGQQKASRIQHSMRNVGSDITSLFTKNIKINIFAQKYFAIGLAILVSISIIARIVSNSLYSKPQGTSAPAIIFSMTVLGVLLYGLEMLTVKQRRNSLRRNVIINAKIDSENVEIIDLSPNDCGLVSNEAIAVGERIVLSLNVPNPHTSKEVKINARVVNSTVKGVTHRVGCVFENLDKSTSDALNEFCMLTYPQSILNGIYEIQGKSLASNVKIPKASLSKNILFIGNGNMRPLVRGVAIVALIAIAIGNLPPYSRAGAATSSGTAGTIAGYVYQDFDLDGVKDAGNSGSASDIGIEGVKVIAVCSDGQTKEALSNSLGEFNISGLAGDCRVNLDNSTFPAGIQSAQIGNDSNSLVQFVPSGTANIGFGLGYSSDYCQSNPSIAVACFSRTDPNLEKSTIYTSAWESGAGITPPDAAYADGKVLRTKTGSIYGLGYKSDTKQLFSSAYLKRKTDFGTGGIGQIYVTNDPTNANPSTSPFINLTTLGVNVGASPRTAANASTVWLNDSEVVNSVDKVGIGDIMVSDDNKTLFAVNMFNKTLVAIDISSKTLKYEKAITTSITNCPASDLRPMGLGKKDGKIYVGVTCSGESSQDIEMLRGYVLMTSDQSASTFSVVSDFKLPTVRQSKGSNPDQALPYSSSYGFNPWKTNIDDAFINGGNYSYPQAIISNIDFDSIGMIIGVRDRYADQTPASGELAFINASRGDTLRACQNNNTGNYILENNGTCGGKSVPSNRATTRHYENLSDPVLGDKQNVVRGSWGPGGAEWFAGDDQYDGDHEGSLGAIAAVPGFKDLAITQYDPTPYKSVNGSTKFFDAAGIRWVNGENGLEKNNTLVYTGEDFRSDFMKVNGLGDLEVLCDQAPVEIGNRVWLDSNANGIQDAGENGIAGVKVELLNASSNVVASVNTDAQGSYKFVLPEKNVTYSVRVDVSTTNGLIPTRSDLGNNDSFDSDGTRNANYVTVAVPALDAGQNNHTFDFGFVQVYALGNKVFEDKDNNGVFGNGDIALANITVNLLNANGVAIAGKTTTTDSNGHYYFADLSKGDYIVEVVTPAGLISSTGSNASLTGTYEPAPDPDVTPKLDNDDNGTKFDGTVTRSKPISLGTNVPSGEDRGNLVNLPDARNDYTVDFGFYKPASLGDKVWLDTNKDGIQSSGENGVANINVTLYQNACGANGIVLGTTTTDSNGNYSFGNLVAGNYYVKFTLPNGMEWTVKGAGSNSALDSNADTTSGCSDIVNLPYGGNDPTIDAGIKTPIVPIDLAVVKTITNKPAAPNTFKPGDLVNYKLEVTNNGPGTAMAGYSVLDILPAGMTYVPSSAVASGYNCTNSGQNITCISNHTLAPNVKESITLQAAIASSFSTPTASLRNVVVVKPNPGDVPEEIPESNCLKNADGTYKDPADIKICNNVDPEEFPLPIDLVIVKSITNMKSPSFLPGDDVNYKLDITNNGPATAIAGFTVTDVLPAELSYKGNVSANGYACVITGKTVVCTSDHALPINVKDTITFTATISASLGNTTQSIVNVASVKPNPDDPSKETIPYENCDISKPGLGITGKLCNNIDPEEFPLPKGASLGDTLWYDLDHDGIQDLGELGVGGARVELHEDTCAGTKLSETTTDANGKYMFNNLTPGKSYVVKFIAPNGTVITTQNVGDDAKDSDASADGCTAAVVLGDGEYNPTIDAGIYKPWASIGDFVWLDSNKNGVQDAGEAGVSGVSVSLLDANGSVVKTILTDANGKYLFTNLEPGDYSVSFVIPSGYTLSLKDVGDNAKDSDVASDGRTIKTTLDPGENDLTWDMGIYVTPASLGDYVWFDDDNDGIQDAGEKPAASIHVILYGESCGGTILAETDTKADGSYKFDNLAPGKYTVKFILPNGATFTIPNAGDDAKDSDVATNGCSHVVTLNPGDNDITIDAGLVKLASLGDFVWIDTDRDGIQDASEVGVEGVHVLLLDKDGNAITGKELVTDNNGKYLFSGLLPGTYSVQFVTSTLPVGYQISPKDKGDDDAKDSDGNITDAKTASVTLNAGEQNLTLDLGINAIPGKLGDKVWEDKDKDGIQDEGEPGIKNAKVELYRCSASGDEAPIATTTTDANGNYIFDNLEAGSYIVKFTTPDGMVLTQGYSGGNRSIDSDAGTNGKSACIVIGPGESNLTIDAGYYTPDIPVKVLPNVVSKQSTLPFTGSESLQLAAFASSLIGTGILAVGFFSRRKRRPGMTWY